MLCRYEPFCTAQDEGTLSDWKRAHRESTVVEKESTLAGEMECGIFWPEHVLEAIDPTTILHTDDIYECLALPGLLSSGSSCIRHVLRS